MAYPSNPQPHHTSSESFVDDVGQVVCFVGCDCQGRGEGEDVGGDTDPDASFFQFFGEHCVYADRGVEVLFGLAVFYELYALD